MTQQTSIEWTDLSWNPVHGCSKVSPGCAHCYAETRSRQYKHTLKAWTPANAAENVLLKPHKLREPLGGGKDWQGLGDAARAAGMTDGKLVFVNSMSDLFHELVPPEYIAEVFAVMALATPHVFQVLTKRPEVMYRLLSDNAFWLDVGDAVNERGDPVLASAIWHSATDGGDPSSVFLRNVWLGVSIENRLWVDRADWLRRTPAAKRFISAEPLLGPLVCPLCGGWGSVPAWGGAPGFAGCPNGCADGASKWSKNSDQLLEGIDWVIVGGESGAGYRRMDPSWAEDLLVACGKLQQHHGADIAFLMKQMGGARPGDRLEDLPVDLRVRDFPQVVHDGP